VIFCDSGKGGGRVRAKRAVQWEEQHGEEERSEGKGS